MRILRPTLTFGILLSVCLLFVGCGTASDTSEDWRVEVVEHSRVRDIVRVLLELNNASDSASVERSLARSNYRIIDGEGEKYRPSEISGSRPFERVLPFISPGSLHVIVEAKFMVPESASGLSLEFRESQSIFSSRVVTLDLPY